ncbi:MAG: type II secretion system minor pseudopilin GspI [Pseudomonadota bacterium]|jgi:general secretion pathway protein I|uniref:type II secretion system minor pseudopilin GspI n=1 Tax=Pseudoalteromonas phenolica TaxID=161398 RepID=UPI00314E0998|tara:strand:- start:3421 stop:3795 length:375 start_codon:yes stop_codon:yes gene_type:complete
MIKKSAGFTLLEVMVALGICAMAGIAAMQVTGEHVSHIASIEEQTYASWVAENRLVMIRAQGDKWNGKNNNKGEEELAGLTWYWQEKVTKTNDPSFVKVQVEVFSDAEYKNSLYDLTTFILKGK